MIGFTVAMCAVIDSLGYHMPLYLCVTTTTHITHMHICMQLAIGGYVHR